MKKVISVFTLCLFLLGMLCSCGSKPLSIQTDSVTQIALTPMNGGTITLDKSQDVTSVMLAVQNASCVTSGTKQDSLPQEEYRFTTYDANLAPLHTMVLYANEYLQVDTVLYKGNLADLQTTLANFCKAASLEDLSPVFKTQPQDIEEIAFYNITDNTFKMVTKQEDIQAVLSPMQSLKISEKEVAGEPSQEIKLYFRLKDTNEYGTAIEITKYESGTLCKVGGKSTQVTNYNWDVLYSKLPYNAMKIK